MIHSYNGNLSSVTIRLTIVIVSFCGKLQVIKIVADGITTRFKSTIFYHKGLLFWLFQNYIRNWTMYVTLL